MLVGSRDSEGRLSRLRDDRSVGDAGGDAGATRDLTYRDGRSDKFWSITLEGQTHTVRYGRSGTAGQTQQKSFPTAPAARASMEKLVAEKLRKGYVEASGAAPTAPPAQPSNPPTPEAQSPAQAAPESPPEQGVAPAPVPQSLAEVTREIALDPRDHLWVTWRERRPEARPEPRPFDRQEALRVLHEMEFEWSSYSGSYWRWERVGITPGLGAEEARFWLAAILRAAIALSQWDRTVSRLPPGPEDVAKALEAEGGDLELDLSLDALQAALSRFGDSRNPFPAQLIVPLSVLLSGPDLVDLLTRERLAHLAPVSPYQHSPTTAPLMTAPLVSGYREDVLPYLAAEELLRFTGPVELATERYAREPLTIAGTTIPTGDLVLGALASANRDHAHFDRPDELDLAREPNRHLAFGQGAHYCLGAPLARLEGRIAFETLLRRRPGLRLAVPASRLRWRRGLFLRGLRALPLSG